MSDLTETEFREAFSLHDNNSGVIPHDKLNTVMRLLGLAPSDNELRELISILDPSSSGNISLNNFVNEMRNRFSKTTQNQNIDEYMESFRLFDRDQDGFISTEELKHIMTTLGEKLSDHEVEDLLKEADPQRKGQIHYESFIRMCLQN
ncbi:hypothetical protein FDP41_000511 [Naegleria fowleri]|uniref:EF-hand domain-containing protein n=1 Tax=Naegleria fowleri TaxID=5763 RepID=A0A6A5CC20_NAEFO|nr:uncharacterized protein FDP41_000511 [Naegleria fowleri]KAF0984612.1 hypothetical protein FDP41_000511 [Naegleria fowleri]CAG4716384.1 unnamed protein product [Naegleria fowleri]